MKIQNTLAVVAGGGSGMGEATCQFLAKQGAKIVVIDKSKENATHVAEKVGGIAIACDITEAAQLEDAFEQIKKLEPLTVAVNCAGIAPAKRMVGKAGPVPLSWFEQILQVNLIGTFNVMRLAADLMIKGQPQESGERGVIVNTASVAAFEGQIGQTAYSASKGGIVAMTLPAARELAQFGIRVVTIAPGLIDTPMLKNMPQEVQDSLKAQTVFPKRFGSPGEYAELVGHIIANPMINGEIIRLDGGMRMQAG